MFSVCRETMIIKLLNMHTGNLNHVHVPMSQ